MINLLLITGHFPPEKSVGCNRPYSLYKYLDKYDINCIVLTKNTFGKLSENERSIYRLDSSADWRTNYNFSKLFYKFLDIIKSKTINTIVDTYWMVNVKTEIEKILEKEKIDIIYVTYPGIEPLVLGNFLKKKYGLPLITEFRDSLAEEPLRNNLTSLQKRSLKNLEGTLLKVSDHIITVTEGLTNLLKTSYKKSKNITPIHHGFFPEDFPEYEISLPKKQATERFSFIHFGSLLSSRKREIDNFFIALQEVISLGFDIHFHFYGVFLEEERNLVNKFNLTNAITFHSIIDRKTMYSDKIKNIDYLFYFGVPSSNLTIASKLFEYIRVGKPIIGICKGEEANIIIEQTGTGECFDYNKDSIKNALIKACEQRISFTPDYEKINVYSRVNQSKDISSIIKNLVVDNI